MTMTVTGARRSLLRSIARWEDRGQCYIVHASPARVQLVVPTTTGGPMLRLRGYARATLHEVLAEGLVVLGARVKVPNYEPSDNMPLGRPITLTSAAQKELTP